MLAKFGFRRPSPAMVVALLALFVALGGSSYAAFKVTGKNVKNSSLTGSDVKNNSLTGKDVTRLGSGDIRDSSLLEKDFKPGQLPAGARGATGLTGAPGLSGVEIVPEVSPYDSVSAKGVTATCPPGKRLIGTGAEILNGAAGTSEQVLYEVVIHRIEPFDTGVHVSGAETDAFAFSWNVVAYAICANVSP